MDHGEEDNTVVVKKEDNYECRACLEKTDDELEVSNLFKPWDNPSEGMENTLAEDLAKLANIELSDQDSTSFICKNCQEQLRNACIFVLKVRKNDRVLRERCGQLPVEMKFTSENVWPKPIQVEKNVNVYDNPMEVEVKQEVDSNEEYSENMYIEELEEYRNPDLGLDIKIEPEEIVEQNIPQMNGGITLNEDNSRLTNGTEESAEFSEQWLDPVVKEEPSSDDEDSVPSDLPLECLLCAKDFKSISGLKAHVIAQHSYKMVKRKSNNIASPEKRQKNDKYVCATCRRSFTTSTDLMVHETCHNKAVCYGCNAKFDTFEQLTRHRIKCKAITSREVQKPKTLEDVKRPHVEELITCLVDDQDTEKKILICKLCNERFTDIYYIRIHQEIHHSITSETDIPQPKESSDDDTESLESIFKVKMQ